MLVYLSADIICSEKRTVFRERKTVSFEEQIMSKDEYSNIFLRKMCLLSFKCFSQRAQFSKLGISFDIPRF